MYVETGNPVCFDGGACDTDGTHIPKQNEHLSECVRFFLHFHLNCVLQVTRVLQVKCNSNRCIC